MRYGLDILMLLLLVAEMTFFYLPPLLHEAVGVTFLLPIAGHLTLNRRYVSSLSRGQWHGPRVLRLLLNLLLAAACLVTVISGCLISSELFADIVPFSLRSKPLLYQLHSAAARYFMVLAGLHFGLQGKAWWQKWLHLAGALSSAGALGWSRHDTRSGGLLRCAAGSSAGALAGRAYLHDAVTLV